MNEAPDLEACASEPIRIPGAIQPHGALLVLDTETFDCLNVSSNLSDVTGIKLTAGDRVTAADKELCNLVTAIANEVRGGSVILRLVGLHGMTFHLHAHITSQGMIVEFEPTQHAEARLESLYPRLRQFLDSLAQAADIEMMARLAVQEVRTLTEFDRALLYTFDEGGDGTVLAEDTSGALPSYLGQRFPASDIPAQARELYCLNRLRLIADAAYRPCPIVPPFSPIDGRPLDLSQSVLRSVSPVHLEYMRNMGTWSSMSISIVVDGRLWGLISGHSRGPRRISAPVRAVCASLGQILSLQVEAREHGARWNERLRLKNIEGRLVRALATALSLQQGLIASQGDWLALTGARGAAVVSRGEIVSTGETPPRPVIERIVARLHDDSAEFFVTDSMAAYWPETEETANVAAGLIAVSISQLHADYILWFRPEFIRQITWSGDPSKPVSGEADRLHPRRSFDAWKEQVRLRSLPWSEAETESATSFRRSVQDLVLRRAEERAALVERLETANRELESFSYSISHDLRAPFRHIVGFSDLLAAREPNLDDTSRRYISTVREAALAAGRLVDGLLNFSHLGRASLNVGKIDMEKLLLEVRRSLETDLASRKVLWEVGALPEAWGDATLIRQVMQNLLQNALKYTRAKNPAVIQIRGCASDEGITYVISDNGVGFEMKYVDKLFGVFQRLHRSEEFEGTGIGLALVKRIIDRHGGSVSARGELGGGASFAFTLPDQKNGRGDPIG